MSGRCYRCGRSLGLVPDDEIRRHRESFGFGGGSNDALRSFCSTRCRAIYRGSDPILDETKQARLVDYDRRSIWTDDGLADVADAIAYGR